MALYMPILFIFLSNPAGVQWQPCGMRWAALLWSSDTSPSTPTTSISAAMVFFLLARLTTYSLLLLHPAYQTHKVLKLPPAHPDTLAQHTRWLMHWVVYAAYTTLESVADTFLFWVPFYGLLKIGVVVWLVAPQTQGAVWVFTRWARPWLDAHEEEVDGVVGDVGGRVAGMGEQVVGRTMEMVRRIANESEADASVAALRQQAAADRVDVVEPSMARFLVSSLASVARIAQAGAIVDAVQHSPESARLAQQELELEHQLAEIRRQRGQRSVAASSSTATVTPYTVSTSMPGAAPTASEDEEYGLALQEPPVSASPGAGSSGWFASLRRRKEL